MTDRPPLDRRALALTALIVFQTVCTGFFVVDTGRDMSALSSPAAMDWHMAVELLATLGLFAGIAVEVVVLRRMLVRAARAERAVGIARGELAELMERYFRDWGLTPAEEDVAAFTLKGYSIAEIARFRGSAEGTVKTHLNAIYRKAGVSGRGQLVSLLIEDLMQSPLLAGRTAASGAPGAADAGARSAAPSRPALGGR